MNNSNYRKIVLIALVICHVTTYGASTTSNDNSVLISAPSEGGFKDGSDGLEPLKDHMAGSHRVEMQHKDGSNPDTSVHSDEEDTTHISRPTGDNRWKSLDGGVIQKRGPLRFREYQPSANRIKRDAQELDKRLDYDRMGKRGFEGKRFTDAMRLGKRVRGLWSPAKGKRVRGLWSPSSGKRAPTGGISSFADALRLGKRYGDAMRLGKRAPMDSMRLGKRLDAMRLGKKSAMDTMRLGKRMDEMRFGKRMDQMRLGKRNFNQFMLNDEIIHSMDSNNGKRMSDVMRLGKRSNEIAEIEPVHLDEDEGKPDFEEFEHRLDEDSDEDFFNIKKRMSDLMRLGKRAEKSPDQMVYGKRMTDLMRLGKRFGYDSRYGKRNFMDDEMRFGKRSFMDDMRMGKRMGDVMRLGKRTPDAMRLGKRSTDYSVRYDIPIRYDFDEPLNEVDFEEAEEQ